MLASASTFHISSILILPNYLVWMYRESKISRSRKVLLKKQRARTFGLPRCAATAEGGRVHHLCRAC